MTILLPESVFVSSEAANLNSRPSRRDVRNAVLLAMRRLLPHSLSIALGSDLHS